MLGVKVNESENAARIVIIGVDGAGNGAVNRMIDKNIMGVEFIGINTDRQVLQFYKAPTAMQTGEKLAKRLGAGARPEVGGEATEGGSEEISQTLKGADIVFVTCGMGGGTGTGAAPVVTKIAKDTGILTVGMATKPFRSEAKTCVSNALSGIERLRNSMDTLIVVPNDRLLGIVDRRTTMSDALKKANEVLQQAVQGVTDLISVPGLINLDFAGVQTVMIDKGITRIGIGKTKGDDGAIEAVKQTISSLLLEATIEGAGHVIINISDDISLIEANKTANYVQELTGDEAGIIFGAMFNEDTQDEAAITVIITDLDEHGANTPVARAMTGFTSFKAKVPTAGAPVGQQAHVAAPEAMATASTPYTSRPASQGYTAHGHNPAGGGQEYAAPKCSPNQGYTGGSQSSNPNSTTAPSQPFRPTVNREMQISIPDFLKNKK